MKAPPRTGVVSVRTFIQLERPLSDADCDRPGRLTCSVSFARPLHGLWVSTVGLDHIAIVARANGVRKESGGAGGFATLGFVSGSQTESGVGGMTIIEYG